MTTVPVLWCSHHPEILARGYADQGHLDALLSGNDWLPPGALTFEHHEVRTGTWREEKPDYEGAVVVFNGRTHASPEDVAWLLGIIDGLPWSIVIICGDEEWDFPWQEIPETDTRRVWAMQPRPEHRVFSGLLPGGWSPGTRDVGGMEHDERPLGWFFGGQITHERREACARELRRLRGGLLVETDGYMRGAPIDEYRHALASAKIIPCPSGPFTVDTNRPLEALEAGCLPIVDMECPNFEPFDYWELVFGEVPFPKIADWSTFPDVLRDELAKWPSNANRASAWWQQWKRRIAHQLHDQIREVSSTVIDRATPDDQITVIITTSPCDVHPSIDHIATVIDSVRAQLPLAEIVIVADGVRDEQEHRRADYEEYLRRLCWATNFEWRNVVAVVLDEHVHQAGAVRVALGMVTTPLVLMVEHDTPLVGEIDWRGLCAFVSNGPANAVRFAEDVAVHPDHEALMLDHQTWWRSVRGDGIAEDATVPVRRTAAWWQRPHLASTYFYRERVLPLLGGARCFIEDALYGTVANAYLEHGEQGWWEWRLWVYSPEGGELGMRRSGHLDSRGEEPKYGQVMP